MNVFPAALITRLDQLAHRDFADWQMLARKLGGALTDQAFFSGGSFLVSILLARWMSPAEYGAFAVAYAWFLLVHNVYDAVLIEPMSIFGAGKFAAKLSSYTACVFYGYLSLTILIVVFIGASALLNPLPQTGLTQETLTGLAIAAPLLVLRWIVRQPLYIRSQPHLAAVSSLTSLLLTIGGLLLVVYGHIGAGVPTLCPVASSHAVCTQLIPLEIITSFSALFILGAASLVSAIGIIVVFIKPDWRLRHLDRGDLRAIFAAHIGYAKWALPSRLLIWGAINFYYILLPMLIGLAGTASFRAVTNLLLPMYLGIGAVVQLITPSLARVHTGEGKEALDARIALHVRLFFAVTGVYLLGLVLFGSDLMHLIYNGKYDHLVSWQLLLAFGMAPLMVCAAAPINVGLRVTGNVRQSYQAQNITALFNLTFGVGITLTLGIMGAALQDTAAKIGEFLLLRHYYRQLGGSPHEASSAAVEH